MIVLSILLFALIVILAAVAVKVVFRPEWDWLNRILIAMIIMAILSGVAAGVCTGTSSDAIRNLEADRNDLMIYYTTVDSSTNEYMRFDYYNKVNSFNNRYEYQATLTESPWFGAFYPRNWQERVAPIVFELRGSSVYN